ncbi:MAG: type II secretion system protein [Alphaproteobacteria bacterium]
MKKNAGFTIIELSLVLIIFGGIAGGLLAAYRLYGMQGARMQTVEAIASLDDALVKFQDKHKYYPCPADPAAGRGDPGYGRSNCGLPPTATPGRGGEPVLTGAVPFATLLDPDSDPATDDGLDLDISPDTARDGWGHRLTYAVTQRLTNPAITSYNDAFGAIFLNDENGNSILAQPGTAHIALVSHGRNGSGAYTPEGVLVGACPPPPAVENENCDGDDAIFLSGLASDNAATFNDDIARAFVYKGGPLWEPIAENSPKIRNINPGNVGIGIKDPEERLHVNGGLTAQRLDAGLYCDNAGGNCMPPEFVGGDAETAGVAVDGSPFRNTCDPGKIAVAIEGNEVICQPIILPSAPCPPGRIAIGIEGDALVCCPPNYPVVIDLEPRCTTPIANCPQQDANLCGTTYDLPFSAGGATFTFNAPAPATASVTYTCTSGAWTAGPVTGSCGVSGEYVWTSIGSTSTANGAEGLGEICLIPGAITLCGPVPPPDGTRPPPGSYRCQCTLVP